MNLKHAQLTAVVLDWAGTTVDHGSRAPAIVFQEIFRRRGVEITQAQAREPMGMAKRDHIAAIAAMPSVAAAWKRASGNSFQTADIDALYEDFLPLQIGILREHSDVIAGVPAVVQACRELGLKIGSTTGYTRALMEIVSKFAAQQGYGPDCILCAEDASRGRPAPYLLYEAAQRLDAYPLWTMVAVDDTPVGIQAGRNAGCWTIGVTRTDNGVGLSAIDFNALSKEEQSRRCDAAAKPLRLAGVHYVVESVAEIIPIISEIQCRLGAGESPVSVTSFRP